MKLEVTGIIYHFQMSAVAVINGANVEGTLSASEQTTLFVPKPKQCNHTIIPFSALYYIDLQLLSKVNLFSYII